MQKLILPETLKKGDTIAIVAPAGKVERPYIERFQIRAEYYGLNVMYGKNLFREHHQFAGTDNERLEDFQWALDNKEIKAIICARGGYGSIRIINKLNWDSFKKSPKWICGFSDITIFHNHLHNLGYQSMHCLMPINIKQHHTTDTPWFKAMIDYLMGKFSPYTSVLSNQKITENIEGEIIGGNLAILCSLLGTPYDIDTTNKILFIEDVGEHYYKVDRMMHTLLLSGKLSKLKAMLVGSFTEMEDGKRPFGKSIEGIISDAVSQFSYPVIFGAESGHQERNYPIVFGRECLINMNEAQEIKWM